MIKTVIILYLVCFSIYLPFSRHPDYFESVMVPAVIHNENGKWLARYGVSDTSLTISADYPLRTNKEGSRVMVIYEPNVPLKASLYKVWGYWLTVGEVLFSATLVTVLAIAAVIITGENQPPPPEGYYKRRKYDV